MGQVYIADGATFLIESVFELYLLAIALRLLFQLVLTRSDYGNPIWQTVVKLTSPLLHPLRRFIPGFHGIDLAAVALLLVVKLIEIYLIGLVVGYTPSPVGALVVGLGELLQLFVYIFLGAILIEVVLSWVGSGTYNAFTAVVSSLAEPVMRPAREVIPPIGGLDLSPLVMIIVLQLVLRMLIAPIIDMGQALML